MLVSAFILLAWPLHVMAVPSEQALPSAQAKTEKPATFFTLQIDQGNDLVALEKTANYITQFLPLKIRIVKEEGYGYAVRSGKTLRGSDLEAYIDILKSVGVEYTDILNIQSSKENVVKIINPDAPESVDQTRDQANILDMRREENPDVVRRMSEIFPGGTEELSRQQRLNKQSGKEAPKDSGALIQNAWEAYQHGSLEIACELFEKAKKQPEVKQEASQGLAHCFFQMGKYKEAIVLLTELLQNGVKPEETRTLLVEALFKTGKYDSALEAAHLLPEARAQQWSALISKIKNKDDVERIRKQYNSKNPEAFIDEHQAYLKQCLLSDIFLTAAWDLVKTKNNKAAAPLFEQLVNACDGQWDTKLSAYAGLMQTMPPGMLLLKLDRELALKNLPPDYSRKLLASKIAILHRIVASLHDKSPKEADKAESLQREILALNPENKNAQAFLAWRYFKREDYPAAHKYFSALYRRYPHDKAVIEGLAFTLARLGKLDEAISLVKVAGDVKLQSDFLREKLTKSLPDSKEATELSQQMLVLDPDDKAALSALAWSHYHHEDYEHSSELFRKLSHAAPENSDYRSGLINGLLKLNRLDEAFSELQRADRHDEAYQKLETRLYMARANRHFQNKKYKESEADLKKVLESSPNDPDARLLMGWSLYSQKQTKAAVDYFSGIWLERPDAGVASVLPGLYDELGMSKEKASFLRQLEQSEKPELRKILADYHAAVQNRNTSGDTRTAESVNSPQSIYFNTHKPSLALNYLYRSRSGDNGTAHLEQQGARLSYKYPLSESQAVSFELTPEHISSGGVKDFSTLSVGTVVGVGDTAMQRSLVTSADLITPTLKFQAEGGIKQSYMLGTTPLNGIIAPMATAAAQYEGRNWQVNLHQEPVIQSILSYTGLNDPFGSRSWGRVVRSGANGTYTFPLDHDYWLSFSGRADYLWGKNVIDNFGAEGGMAAGKSITTSMGSLTLGAFVTNIHFERNVNFYTFGQGGYYSPNYLLAAGPFLNFEYKAGNKIWWKTELSGNRFHSETADAPFFPLQNERPGESHFAGSVKDGIGYRVAVEGRYLVNPYLDVGGRFSLEQAAAFNDMASNLGIRLYFSPRNSLVDSTGF